MTRHLHRHSFRYSSPHKVPDGAFPYAQALADLARCAAGRFQPRRLFREMVETRATPHGLDGESTRPAAQKIPVLPDKELIMASSIRHILRANCLGHRHYLVGFPGCQNSQPALCLAVPSSISWTAVLIDHSTWLLPAGSIFPHSQASVPYPKHLRSAIIVRLLAAPWRVPRP